MLEFKSTYNLYSYAKVSCFDRDRDGQLVESNYTFDIIDICSSDLNKINHVNSIIEKIKTQSFREDSIWQKSAEKEFNQLSKSWYIEHDKIASQQKDDWNIIPSELNQFKKTNPKPTLDEIKKKHFISHMTSKFNLDGVERISGIFFDRIKDIFNQSFIVVYEVEELFEVEEALFEAK